MLYIFNKSNNSNSNSVSYNYECKKPKDWEFMRQSGEVLDNPPETWKAYPDTEAGKVQIIKMEYEELMKTNTPEDQKHELVHLASACLCLWRKLNNITM